MRIRKVAPLFALAHVRPSAAVRARGLLPRPAPLHVHVRRDVGRLGHHGRLCRLCVARPRGVLRAWVLRRRAARRALRHSRLPECAVRGAPRGGRRSRSRLDLAAGTRNVVRHRDAHVHVRGPAPGLEPERAHRRKLRSLPAAPQPPRGPRHPALLLLDARAPGRRDPRVDRDPALEVRPRSHRDPGGGGQGGRLGREHLALQDPGVRDQRLVRRGGRRAARPVPQLRRPGPRLRAHHHAQPHHHEPRREPRHRVGPGARCLHPDAAVAVPHLPHALADRGAGPPHRARRHPRASS